MIRGLKSKFAKSNSSTNVAAGSGAQGASVINTSKVGNDPDTAAVPDEGEAVEPKRTGSSSSKAIVAAEDPAGNGWAYEDVWSYVDSMGVTKIPGEEHILRFLADCLHVSPLPAPWAVHKDGEGRVFYGNSGTGETTWEHPLEEIVRELAGVCRVCVTLSRPMRERSIVDLREAWEAQAKEEFALWYSVKDSTTGKDYFCNSRTGQTMWEHPAEVLLPGHFLKLRAADRLIDDEYLQDLATMGSTLNEGSGQTWNSMKRTLESGISTRASNDVKDDAHQAMKEELASTATELRAAREDAAKVRAQFEALKERFEEAKRNAENEEMLRSKAEARLEQEQQKLEGVQKDLDILKDKFDQAQRSAQDVELKHSQAEAKLQEEQQKLQSAIAECEALKQQQQASNQSSTDAQATMKQELAATTEQLQAAKDMLAEAQRNAQEVEVKRSQVQVQLETEQQRLQSAITECEAWKQQAIASKDGSEQGMKQLEQFLSGELEAERKRTAELQQKLAEQTSNQASEAAATAALRQELEQQKEAEVSLQKTVQNLQAELEQQKAASNSTADSQQATAKELETTASELKSARAEADKVKEEFEALKERLDVAQRSAEEVELKRSQAEEKLAAEQQRLVAVQEELDMHKESAQKLQAEFDAQKESLQTAHRSTDETDKKRTVAEEQLAAEQQKLQTVQAELDAQKESLKEAQRNAHELEVKRSQAEAQLATQQQRLQSAVDECEIWKQQATASKDGSQESVKKLQETLLADLQAERQRSATLQQEIALQSSKQAMEAAAMQQLQDELQRQKAAEVTMRATMQTLQAELEQEKAAVQQEVAIRTASKAADASATRNLQEELERRQAAEATLRTTMQNLQEELAQERARAAEAASKYAAVSKVREAALQEVDTVESQTRNLREEMEVQLLEERQKAKELEAKYEALRDAHETAVRVFAESVNAKEEASARMPPAEGSIAAQALQVAIQEALGKEKAVREGLLKDQERLEETTKSLREQMQKVHTVASELEAKVQQSKSRLDAAEGERRAVVQTVVSEDATHADQALRRQIESARQVELQLESRASAAKASLEEERRRVEQLKLEYTNLLQGQQDTVQASQKHLETKLEELGCQMREMRSTLESGRITSNQDDLAKQLAQVSAVNAKLETAVAREAKSLGPTRPSPSPLKAAPSEDVRVAKSPKRSGMQEAPLLKRGREPRVREFDGKMWARTDDAVLTGQRVRHLMLESLAARQQTRMYKEMIQEFDASEVGQKAKLSSAKAALQSLNSSLRGQVEQARRELEQLEKARQAGPVPQT